MIRHAKEGSTWTEGEDSPITTEACNAPDHADDRWREREYSAVGDAK